MRKKTQNEDIAKRAKNLIKKWQSQVSVMNQHPRNNLNGIVNNNDTNSRPNSRTGNKELHKNNNETSFKVGVKRKRASGENSPMPVPPNRISSPLVRPSSPHVSRLTQKTSKSSSPRVSLQKNCVENRHGSPSSNINNTNATTSGRNTPVLNIKKHTSSDNHKNIKTITNEKQLTFDVDVKRADETYNSSPNLQKTKGFSVNTPSDTRIQENRISSNVLPETSDEKTTNSLDFNSRVFKPIATSSEPLTASTETELSRSVPTAFEAIPEEELSVTRRELPDDIISPDIPADGINGVFNENNEFREWTDEVVWRDKDYHILPYVILD